MKPVTIDEILGLGEYEGIRERFRTRIIEEKRARRLGIGPRATCVFENHDTALFQIQEMLRTERITKRSAIEHEIATYNELVPGENELSATVMIEIDDKVERDAFLTAAVGLEKTVYLKVDGSRVGALCAPDRQRPDVLSAVMYLKFPLGSALAARVRTKAAAVSLGVDHPLYPVEVPLPREVVLSIAQDLE